MSNTFLFTKEKALHTTKSNGGNDFRDLFWETFEDKSKFEQQIDSLKESIKGITKLNVQDDTVLYIEAHLDEKSTSKTNRPSDLWKKSNLDIIESNSNQDITLKGKKSDLVKFENIIADSTYEKAKTRVDGNKRIDMNITREVFAVSSITDRNTGIAKRVNQTLLQYILNDHNDNIDCIIELYYGLNLSDYDYYYGILCEVIEENRISKTDTDLFTYNMYFKVSINIKEIQKILNSLEYNFVRRIKTNVEYIVQRSRPNIVLSSILVDTPETSEVVGVIDSGIDHPLLLPLKQHELNYIDKSKSNHYHGNFVASRILYGHSMFNDINTNGKLRPCAKIMDIIVLQDIDSSGETKLRDFDIFKKAVNEVVKRYKDVHIFNISINKPNQVDEDDIDEMTQFLDKVARDYDVIFVCSAGNQFWYQSETYDTLFRNPSLDIQIASPADALNVITVGSISDNCSNDTICEFAMYPSPFTRKGGIRGGWKKPELVSEGGNIKKDLRGLAYKYDQMFINVSNNTFGVDGLADSGFVKDHGTSLSAPLVTRECAYLLDYIKKSSIVSEFDLQGNRANLTKAILIHSTAKSEQASIADLETQKAYGFGKPSFKNGITDNENQASILYLDKIDAQNKKHSLQIVLPEYLLHKPVNFLFTLVYNPPTNKNFISHYNLLNIQPSLRLLIPNEGPKSINPQHSWSNYRTGSFNTIHFKRHVRSLKTTTLEVLVQLTLTEHLIDTEIEQPYALILTVEDPSNENRLRQEMLLTNNYKTLVENIIINELEVPIN